MTGDAPRGRCLHRMQDCTRRCELGFILHIFIAWYKIERGVIALWLVGMPLMREDQVRIPCNPFAKEFKKYISTNLFTSSTVKGIIVKKTRSFQKLRINFVFVKIRINFIYIQFKINLLRRKNKLGEIFHETSINTLDRMILI